MNAPLVLSPWYYRHFLLVPTIDKITYVATMQVVAVQSIRSNKARLFGNLIRICNYVFETCEVYKTHLIHIAYVGSS